VGWWKRGRVEKCAGSTFFRGTLAPTPAGFAGLERRGFRMTPRSAGEDAHWALDLSRGRHEIALLSDWLIMTPFGSITPRSMSPARELRARKDEVREQLRMARGGAT